MSSRTCAKPGCTALASATLVFDYAGRSAWMDALDPESHPMHYDLCAQHADHLRVPQGWTYEDRRPRYPSALAS